MSERPYSREIAWLRVAVWTIPGIAILLIFRYGETFLSPSGVRAGESYLILLAIAVSIFSCGTCTISIPLAPSVVESHFMNPPIILHLCTHKN